MELTLRILNKDGIMLAETSGENGLCLVYNGKYADGDKILLSASEYPAHLVWQVDDALGQAQCYVTRDVVYQIPFGEKKTVYSPKTFSGEKHHLFVRTADNDEIEA